MTYPLGPLNGGLAVDGNLTGRLTSGGTVNGALSTAAATTPAYEGSYEFTPTQETQTVEVSGLRCEQNITINPIPSNYGLITWNGSTLTVS